MMQTMPKYNPDGANTKLIEKFEEHWEKMDAFWSAHHEKHKHDMQFTWFKNQWDKAAKEERKSSGRSGTDTPLPPRPTLVFDISSPFIIKAINGIMKMRPALKVSPVDDDSDVKDAEILAGQIRFIERNTGAVDARMEAVKQAVTAGYGFYRFDTEYANPHSFDHDVKYRTISDATTVLFDEQSKNLNGSDCMKVIFNKEISDNEFKRLTGKEWKDWSETNDLTVTDDTAKRTCWGTHESPSINEWWYVEENPETLVQITIDDVIPPELAPEQQQEWVQSVIPEEILKANGEGMFTKELEKAVKDTQFSKEDFMDADEDGEYITRKSQSRRIIRCKLVGKKIIERIVWPGYWIPVFKVSGRVTRSDGEVNMEGLSRPTQASQKAYNYARNNKLERLALSPKIPWIYAEGSVNSKNKKKMNTANVRNWPSIAVKSADSNGNPYFKPYRPAPVDIDPGLINEEQTASTEINSTLGMYGAYTGQTSNEKSGRAIQAGAAESADVVYDFPNNLGKTMDFEGKVLGELIPKVHDKPKQVRIIGEDDEEKVVWILKQAQDEKGQPYYHDLSKGKFDVTYSMGPSSETKRVEQRDEMEVLFGGAPELREILADEFVKTHDWEGADKLAERIKAFINIKYPGLIKDDDNPEAPSEKEQQMQQFMQQLQEQVELLMKENEQLKSDKSIESKKVENEDMDNEEKNEIELEKADTARMKVENDAAAQAAKIQLEREKLRDQRIEAERKFQLEMAKLNDQKESRLNDTTTDQGRQEVSKQYDGMISELKASIESIRSEISGRERELPEINITNVIPGKQDAKIKGPGGKEYNVTYEDKKN